ncbi:MAG TPA: topoisomerase IV [Clostridiaceae bacterium]|jgi:DNA gyrase subunit A|nr:topoisomerase IV [Clostridiaceae bacterium]
MKKHSNQPSEEKPKISLKSSNNAESDGPAIIEKQLITDTLESNYMPYAMSVIVSRAIPEIDGFKPSHRKLLYTMYKMGLLGSTRTKSANVVGQTMKLNPHGDMAIYETMVRLTRGNGSLLHPYVDSKGNFGRNYSRDMQFAASRYTEVKLDKICEELFKGLDRNAVDFIDNYDSTMKEPTLLPSTFPSILVNSNQGIAVGMASNICSFNLEEVCRATIAYMKDPMASLMDIMPGPDFSGGGVILYDDEAMQQVFDSGRGAVRVRSKYRVDRKQNMIEIYEIPYTTTAEAIIDEISELVRSSKVKEVSDVRDETDLDGLCITIEYKRGTDPDELMTKLFRFTKLEDTFSCNFNILINGMPRVLGVKSIIAEWLSWRRACQKREILFDVERKQNRLHLLDGLAKILLDIDRAIAIIRNTEFEADVVPNLMDGFDIDALQAEYVAEIKLRNINRQYIINRTADRENLIKDIDDLNDILSKPKRLDSLIIKSLEDVAKKYGKPRQSELLHIEQAATFSADKMIEDYNLKLFMTEHGYIKKIPLTSLRSAGELKTKDEDNIIIEKESKNKSEVIFFSDKAVAYKLRIFELADTKPSELGGYLPNILDMEEGERIIYMVVTDDYVGEILFGYENGKVSKIPLKAYETKQNRKKLLHACYEGSLVIAVHHIFEDADFAAITNQDKVVIFNSTLIPLKTTRSSQGIQVIVSKKGSKLSNLIPIQFSGLNDPERYRIRKTPSVGYYLKEKTLDFRQITLGDV